MNPQSKARTETIQYFNGYMLRDQRNPMMGAETVEFIEKSAYDKAVEALKEIAKHKSSYSGESSPEANLAKKTLRELGVECDNG